MWPRLPYVMGFDRRRSGVAEPPVADSAIEHPEMAREANRRNSRQTAGRYRNYIAGGILGLTLLGLGTAVGVSAYANKSGPAGNNNPPTVREINPPNNRNPVISPVIAETPAPTLQPIPPTTVIKPSAPTPKIEPTTTPKSEVIPTLIPIPTATPIPTGITGSVPKTSLKSFEFICRDCTPEESKKFHDIAYTDYLNVLKVYGIKEEDAIMKVYLSVTGEKRGEYGFRFEYDGRIGGQGWQSMGDWTEDPNDRGIKHEMGHAFNNTFFGRDTPSWLDEGLAMYVSGEVDSGLQGGGSIWLYDNPNRPNEATPYSVDEALTILRNNPTDYWKRRGPASVPSHIIGWHLYALMIRDYHITPEQNRTAIQTMMDTSSISKSPPTKMTVQASYESVLGTNLDHLFNDLLVPGVAMLYTDQKVRNDFGIK